MHFSSSLLSQNLSENIATFLSQQSGIFIKSYGVSGLAAPSTRGTNFGHTAIIWNGFNIQSPMNGGLDLALLPISLVDDIKMQYGGSSALFGSGSIGGTLHLDNQPKFETKLYGIVGGKIGSFNNVAQYSKIGFGTKKTATSFNFFHSSGKNDFTYIKGNKLQSVVNSASKNWNVGFNEKIKLVNSQELSFNFWYQDSYRQIPPSATSNNNLGLQEDKSIKTAIGWKKISKNIVWQARLGFFEENIFYKDIFIESPSKAKTFASAIEFTTSNKKLGLINFTLNQKHDIVNIPTANVDNRKQDRLAVSLSLRKELFKKKLNFIFNVREDFIDQKWLIPNTSISISKTIKPIFLSYKASRNFRIPTFNDLYFTDAFARGNPNLIEEFGWGHEINIKYKYQNTKFSFNNVLSIYSQNINNWIQWLNQDGVWSPENFKRIWSRGIEYDGKFRKQFYNFNIISSISHRIVFSTISSVKLGVSEKTIGKQLPYVPIYKGGGNIGLTYKNTSISYNHSFSNQIFTNADNSTKIQGYQLGNIILSQNILYKNTELKFNISLNNIWNKNYQVVQNFFMPRRNYSLELQLIF